MMEKLWSLMLPPRAATVHISDSHDVTGFNDDGFSSTYSYLYHEDGRIDRPVLFDVKGSGRLTLIRTGGFYDGELLVHIDDEPEPRVWPVADLFAGRISGIPSHLACDEQNGHGSAWAYVDVAFCSRCKIVASGVGGDYHFYSLWSLLGDHAFPHADGYTASEKTGADIVQGTVGTHGYSETMHLDEAGVISELSLRIASPELLEKALSSLYLRMWWDGAEAPAVNVPIGLFFACGYSGFPAGLTGSYDLHFRSGKKTIPTGRVAPQALPVGESAPGHYYCRFPMPFASSARIQLVNTGETVLSVSLQAEFIRTTPPDGFSHFHALYRAERSVLAGRDYTLLQTRGSGHYAGCVLRASGKARNPESHDVQRFHLEGDSRFYIDDTSAFVCAGTGTEEYFNWGWYDTQGKDMPFTYPLSGYTEHIVDTEDRSTMYRFHVMDPVPFRRSFRYDLEHGPDGRQPGDYESVAFYYLNPGIRSTLIGRLSLADDESRRAHEYAEEGTVFSAYSTKVWEGNDQVTADQLAKQGGEDWGLIAGVCHRVSAFTGKAAWKLKLPKGTRALRLRRLYDGMWPYEYRKNEPENAKIAGYQQATVFIDGQPVGTWYLSPHHARNCWMQDEFLIDAKWIHGKDDVEIVLESNGEAHWCAGCYWMFAES